MACSISEARATTKYMFGIALHGLMRHANILQLAFDPPNM